MSSNPFSGLAKLSTVVEVTPTPFVKLRRSLVVEEGISEKTFRPTSIARRRVKQLIKGNLFGSFLCWQRNEQQLILS